MCGGGGFSLVALMDGKGRWTLIGGPHVLGFGPERKGRAG